MNTKGTCCLFWETNLNPTALYTHLIATHPSYLQVLLLGRGGRTAFLGKSQDALTYFQDDLEIALPPFTNPGEELGFGFGLGLERG